jgi:hypothetical protein
MDTWQSHTSSLLWGTLDPSLSISHINTSVPADNNGMRFATIADNNGHTNTILALTITWYRSVAPSGYEIFHWNQLYNTGISNRWGDATLEANVFDLPSTLTHELGHSIGLVDIFNAPECTDVTMFFSGSINEVKKKTLEAPDIQGEQTLYGGVTNVAPPTVLPGDSSAPPLRSPVSSSTTTLPHATVPSMNDSNRRIDSLEMCFWSLFLVIFTLIC